MPPPGPISNGDQSEVVIFCTRPFEDRFTGPNSRPHFALFEGCTSCTDFTARTYYYQSIPMGAQYVSLHIKIG